MLKGFVSGEEKDIVRIPMKGRNLIDESKVTLDTYLSEADGKTGSSTVSDVTDYIDINASPLVISGVRTIGILNSTTRGACFYDSNKNYIRGFAYSPDVMSIPVIISNIPSNAKYVRFAFDKAFENGIMLNTGTEPLPYEPYGYQEGWEVRDNQDHILWGREDELQTATGTLPFKGYSLPLKVKSILGNAVQNGTPSPDNIITPEMCGVRTANVMPFAAAQTITSNGITFESDGKGGYTVKGYSTAAASAVFQLSNTFTIPNSVGNGGNGTLSFWNTKVDSVVFGFMFNDTVIDEWSMLAVNRQHDAYSIIANQKCNAIRLYVAASKSCDQKIQPELTDNGEYPTEFEPYGWKITPVINQYPDLSIIDTDSYSLNDWYYKDTRLTGLLPPGTYTISFVTDSITAGTTTDGTIGIGTTSDYTEDLEWFTRAVAGSMTTVTVTLSESKCLWARFVRDHNIVKITCSISVSKIRVEEDSVPYGYKAPIYLGEVPTVRRIKKVVFTGQETWTEVYPGEPEAQAQGIVMYATSLSEIGTDRNDFRCSHFFVGNYRGYLISGQGRINGTSTSAVPEGFNVNYNNGSGGLQNFKAWLASEYAAGHPVTLWYALATEQTSVVNEPLCKISTYADELITIQVHGLSAPLYGIGDYKDTLNLSTGVVTRKVKKLVLTGNEQGWTKYKSGAAITISSMKDNMRNIGLCSHFTGTFSPSTETEDAVCFGASNNIFYLLFSNATTSALNITDLNSIKQWLQDEYSAGHPVTIWYVLNTQETETVTVPTGMTGEIEGYLTQVSTPTPTNRSVPKWNGVEETGGTYAVTVYTPPEIPTTTGENTLTVDANLAPSSLTVKGHIKELT